MEEEEEGTLASANRRPMRDEIRRSLNNSAKFPDMELYIEPYLEEAMKYSRSRFSKSEETLLEDLSLLSDLDQKLDTELKKAQTALQTNELAYIQILNELFKMHLTKQKCKLTDADMPEGVQHWTPPEDVTEQQETLDYIKYRGADLKDWLGMNEYELVDPNCMKYDCKELCTRFRSLVPSHDSIKLSMDIMRACSHVKLIINSLQSSLCRLRCRLLLEQDKKRERDELTEYSTTDKRMNKRVCTLTC